ncbi:protein of unknown function [Methanoculleus bourgensis]|uniref:carbonic anhydrase n=1 Tax=Methanoculleus bourgensis TaxID=83986 RepID=A0A0X3BNQ5_9EURY|nr:protein of unknown function [Methanoculleus bourgensis]
MIEKFLEGNERFREEDFGKNPDHYNALASSQHPVVLWIGCSDSRVDPERITGAQAGEIFVQRNIGNIVPVHDWNFATVLEYALNHLQVGDIVICGHSDCGAIKGLDHESDDAYVPLWLNNAMERNAVSRPGSRCQRPRKKKTSAGGSSRSRTSACSLSISAPTRRSGLRKKRDGSGFTACTSTLRPES